MDDLTVITANSTPQAEVFNEAILADAPPPTSHDLDQMALGWHAQGKTYRQIAELMNISRSNAHTRVQRCLAEQQLRIEDFCLDLRQQVLSALEQSVQAVAAKADQGDLDAFRALLTYVNTSIRMTKVRDTRRWAKRIHRYGLGNRPDAVVGTNVQRAATFAETQLG